MRFSKDKQDDNCVELPQCMGVLGCRKLFICACLHFNVAATVSLFTVFFQIKATFFYTCMHCRCANRLRFNVSRTTGVFIQTHGYTHHEHLVSMLSR